MSTLSLLPEALPEALALPAPAALAAPRRIRVSYASRFHDGVNLAALTLRGKWLEEAGFPTGTDTDVRVMPGCIVITARTPEPEDPPLLKSLRRVCKLSARKQQQVQELSMSLPASVKKPDNRAGAVPARVGGLTHVIASQPDIAQLLIAHAAQYLARAGTRPPGFPGAP